jgi:hypothetical protein
LRKSHHKERNELLLLLTNKTDTADPEKILGETGRSNVREKGAKFADSIMRGKLKNDTEGREKQPRMSA